MQCHSIQVGQTEIGVVEHNGRSFSALGASTHGCHVTGYLEDTSRGYKLTNWSGKTTLSCRSWEVRSYRLEDGATSAVVFQLTNGRYVVGYSLGNRMLFRGELVECGSQDDAEREACHVSERLIEIDREDQEAFQDA